MVWTLGILGHQNMNENLLTWFVLNLHFAMIAGLPEPKAVAQADLIARIRQELQRIYDQSMVTLRQCRVPGQRKPVHLTADHKDRVQRLHTVDKAVTAVIDALVMPDRSSPEPTYPSRLSIRACFSFPLLF